MRQGRLANGEPSLELQVPFSSGLVFVHEGNQAIKQHLRCSPKKRSIICVQTPSLYTSDPHSTLLFLQGGLPCLDCKTQLPAFWLPGGPADEKPQEGIGRRQDDDGLVFSQGSPQQTFAFQVLLTAPPSPLLPVWGWLAAPAGASSGG